MLSYLFRAVSPISVVRSFVISIPVSWVLVMYMYMHFWTWMRKDDVVVYVQVVSPSYRSRENYAYESEPCHTYIVRFQKTNQATETVNNSALQTK